MTYRPPQQQRSKESFERILDAAEELIRERGFDAMTVAEVVQRSDSSVGSLYARFHNKLGLLQAVQARYHARVESAIAAEFRANAGQDSLGEAAYRIVRVLSSYLLNESELFRAFVVEAVFDPVVRSQGESTNSKRRDFVTEALLAHRDEIAHQEPELAVRWFYTVCMAMLRERITYGPAAELAGGFDDETTVRELSRMLTAYLKGEVVAAGTPAWATKA